jgi:hypothetical protein
VNITPGTDWRRSIERTNRVIARDVPPLACYCRAPVSQAR